VTDKALLADGRPTQIHGEALAISGDATAEECIAAADEIRRRREATQDA
jgi:hypothetical protein